MMISDAFNDAKSRGEGIKFLAILDPEIFINIFRIDLMLKFETK